MYVCKQLRCSQYKSARNIGRDRLQHPCVDLIYIYTYVKICNIYMYVNNCDALNISVLATSAEIVSSTPVFFYFTYIHI